MYIISHQLDTGVGQALNREVPGTLPGIIGIDRCVIHGLTETPTDLGAMVSRRPVRVRLRPRRPEFPGRMRLPLRHRWKNRHAGI